METARSSFRVLAALAIVVGSVSALMFGAVRGALAVDDAEQCRDALSVFDGSIWTTRSRINQHEAMVAEPPADAGLYWGWESTRVDDPTEYIDWMEGVQRRIDDCESTLIQWDDTSASELAQMREEVRVLTECIRAWGAVQPGNWPHPSTQCRPCSGRTGVVLTDEVSHWPDSGRWCVSALNP